MKSNEKDLIGGKYLKVAPKFLIDDEKWYIADEDSDKTEFTDCVQGETRITTPRIEGEDYHIDLPPNGFGGFYGSDREAKMRKEIVEAFPKTEDAVLVDHYYGWERIVNAVIGEVLKEKADVILEKAKKRKEEAEKE